jgi:hypothetical protein
LPPSSELTKLGSQSRYPPQQGYRAAQGVLTLSCDPDHLEGPLDPALTINA